MKLQDYVIDVTQAAADEAFRYAKAIPAEKWDWKPLDAGRSVLDIARELAMCPTWAVEVMDKPGPPEFSDEGFEETAKLMQQWTTIDACQAECNRRLNEYFDYLRKMPDERLSETKWLPYGGGRDFKMSEMMDYPRWNFTYHVGQLAYIQTLYGDKEMY
jgi:hypothetical protein